MANENGTKVDDPVREVVEGLFALQRRVFGETWPRDIQSLLERYYLLISVELTEAIQCTNFKHHKRMHSIDMEPLRDECIDVLIYAFDMCGTVFDGDYDAIIKALQKKAHYNNVRKDWELNQKVV